MYVWTLGITDRHPATWKSHEPLWEDEKLTASSSHSFHDVMHKLCETAIKNRREYDHTIDEHLWNMKIVSMEDAIDPRAAERERMLHMYDGSDGSDESDGSGDEDEQKYRGNITIQCPGEERRGEHENFDDPDAQVLSSNTKLDGALLPQGHVVKVTYDYGTTTMLYLKVLSVKAQAVESLLQYFLLEADSTKMMDLLKAIPAYNLPKEQQVDAYFPYASKACMGFYVPLFTQSSEGRDIGENRKVMGCLTMGLSGKLRSEEDVVFCSMEDRTQSRDILCCPGVIEPNELLQVIDKAWEPRDKSTDSDKLDQFRYDWINRLVVAADNDEKYESVAEMIEEDPGYGSKKIVFRLDKDWKKSDFNFQKAFPKTYAMLTCGKFRWFQYKNDVLRVIVGRGVGRDSRQCEGKQILKTWKHSFPSFHEMLCAVEASWTWEGKELTADTVLPEFDTDLGPSCPLPKEPPCYGKEKDAIMISSCSDKKKLVTALAISEEEDGKTVLYSGHDDGTLTKWSLEDNEQIWSKKIYADGTKDFGRDTDAIGLLVKDTPGVAGIVIRPEKNKPKQAVVYTWTHAYEGYPHIDHFKVRGPSKLKAWSGADGKLIRSYACDVGYDEDGKEAHPSISSVVFCKAFLEGHGFLDHIVVGLHCCCNGFKYDDSFSTFDIDAAEDYSEGNIVPFLEHYPNRKLDTWRGQGGIIRAMAVIESERYLLSYSIHLGHGMSDELVVWSLRQPGVPLCKRGLYRQVRLSGVAGLSVKGTEILFADSYADRIAAVTIKKDGFGDPYIKVHGYASVGCKYYEDEGFHGRMSMSKSKYGVMAMEINQTAWIFQVEGSSKHKKLDRRDGDPRKFEKYYLGDEEKRAGREMAAGKVYFPLWGGNKPARSKKRSHFGMESEDDSDGLGKGGPVQVAMRGRNVVAGFSNGTLSRFLLPEQFEESSSNISSNHLVSCGTLPSDEWHVPILECKEEEEEGQSDSCVIQ